MKTQWLSDQPGWVKSIILGTGICVFIGLMYFLDFRPTFRKIKQEQNRIAALTVENDAFRKEIIHFKKPTPKEIQSWESLSGYLRERIPREKETLLAARLLAEKAAQNQLMDVTIKVPTVSASSLVISQIAGKHPTVKTRQSLFKQFGIQSFDMEMDYVSSLKSSLAFLDAIGTNPTRYLETTQVKISKDFPFIRTNVIIRFFYGGRLNVKE